MSLAARRRFSQTLVLAVVGLAALSPACSSGGDESTSETAGESAHVVTTVEASELAQPRELRVCSDLDSAPLVFRAGDGVVTGLEADFVAEAAGRLGLEPVWVRSARSRFVANLVTRRCDVIAARLSYDLPFQSKVGILAYAAVPLSLLVPTATRSEFPREPDGEALCGRRLAVVALTGGAFRVPDYADACQAAGEPPPAMTTVETTRHAVTLAYTGSVDAVLEDGPIAAWFAEHVDTDVASVPIDGSLTRYGFAYRRFSTSTTEGLRGALLVMHQEGVANEIRDRWSLRDELQYLPLP